MMMTDTATTAQDILMSFAVEGEPTPTRLEAFAKEHPGLRRELTELAVELVLERSRSIPAADDSTGLAVSSAWARFQAAAKSGRETYPALSATMPANVFAGVSGPAFPRLAARLGLTPAFLIKLRDGLIQVAGFPNALVELIAAEVGHEVAAVRALLERPASIPLGTMAKADGKPEAGSKQSFAQAVETSGLSAEQRRRLLAMAEVERGRH